MGGGLTSLKPMRPWPARSLPYLLPPLIGAACVTVPNRPQVLDFEDRDTTGIPFRLFPELGPVDTSYRWFGGSVPADPQAPVCAAAASRPASWRVERVVARSRFLEAIEVTLPPALLRTGRTDFGVSADAETLGGVLVASWGEEAAPPLGDHRARMQVAVWVGPEDGYPTIGADTASRQLHARQCRLATADGERFVLEFAIRDPRTTQEYLGAVWRVARERYLRVLISGLDAASLPDARAIVESMRAIPRSR
jgi:hypothetical protein